MKSFARPSILIVRIRTHLISLNGLLIVVDTTILCDLRNLKKDLKQVVCDRMTKCGDENIRRAPDDVKNAYKKWEIHNCDLKYQTLEPIIPTP